MKIKNFFKRMFHKEPKQYFTYRMLCRKCDLIFERLNAYENRCPLCGDYTEVYSAEPIEGKIYDNRA